MVFAVINDIDSSKRDYSKLYEKLKSLGVWMHYLEYAWLISPSDIKTPRQLHDELYPL